jgi:transcription initiation factor IIE alpha subunit
MYSCAIDYRVMKDPVGMKFCLAKQLCDHSNLKLAFEKNKNKCPMCGSNAKYMDVVLDGQAIEIAQEVIENLRKRIQFTFERLTPKIK